LNPSVIVDLLDRNYHYKTIALYITLVGGN